MEIRHHFLTDLQKKKIISSATKLSTCLNFKIVLWYGHPCVIITLFASVVSLCHSLQISVFYNFIWWLLQKCSLSSSVIQILPTLIPTRLLSILHLSLQRNGFTFSGRVNRLSMLIKLIEKQNHIFISKINIFWFSFQFCC